MNSPLENYPHHKQFAEMYKGSNLVSNYRTLYADWVLDEFQALLQRQQSDALRIEKLVGLLKDYAESGWGSEKDISKTLFKEACEALSESGVTSIDLHGEPYAINTRLKEPK